MAGTIEVTDANFNELVVNSDTPVVVDFWAPWCGPCKLIGPLLEELAVEYSGRVKVAKMNVDNNRNTPAAHSITGIPTLIVYRNGEVSGRMVGFKNKQSIQALFDNALS